MKLSDYGLEKIGKLKKCINKKSNSVFLRKTYNFCTNKIPAELRPAGIIKYKKLKTIDF